MGRRAGLIFRQILLLFGVLANGLLAGSVMCGAQVARPDASQTAAADDQPPAANPSRPTVTNPATITPVGYLQFEQGYLGSLNSPETASQYGVNSAIKLAVTSRVMLQFVSQPFAVSTVTAGQGSTRDAGDLLAGAQIVLYNPPDTTDEEIARDIHRHAYVRSAIPTVAFTYLQRVHSGTAPDIDLGSFSRSAYFLFSGHAPGIDVHYDINIVASEQSDDSVAHPNATYRRAQFGQTLSIDRPIGNPKLQLSLELYHFSQPTVHTTSSGAVIPRANLVGALFALSYQLRPNLVFDGGFEHGLTSTSTQWQSFTGFTYLLPHRLWRERANKAAASKS